MSIIYHLGEAIGNTPHTRTPVGQGSDQRWWDCHPPTPSLSLSLVLSPSYTI